MQVESVTIKGRLRGAPVFARFTAVGEQWRVLLNVGGEQRELHVDRKEKACATVAACLIDQAFGKKPERKPRPKRERRPPVVRTLAEVRQLAMDRPGDFKGLRVIHGD